MAARLELIRTPPAQKLVRALMDWIRTPLARKLGVALLIVVALAGIALWYAGTTSAGTAPALVAVEKGDLTVKITERGEVRASKFASILSGKDGPVAYVVPEGTEVKAGDVVVRFDATQQEAAVAASKVDMQVTQAELRASESGAQALRGKLKSDLARLEADYKVAQVELAEFKNKPLPDEVEKARLELEKAKVTFEQAEKKRALMPNLVAKGYITQGTVDEAELNYLAAKAGLQVAKFTFDKVSAGATRAELDKATIKVEIAKFVLDSARASMNPQLDAIGAAIDKHRADVKKTETAVRKAQDELERTQLRAPQDGLAVYGSRGSGGEKIHAGMMTWAGASLINLPDMSTMIVDTQVNEIDVGKVANGAPALVKLEAYPGAVYHGKVTEIGTVAKIKKNEAGANTPIKVFDVRIQIDKKDARVKPGLTAVVDIIVDEQRDVLTVPLSAVVERPGGAVVFLGANHRNFEERKVVLGPSNNERVVVKDGLHAGDLVVLEAPPPGRR